MSTNWLSPNPFDANPRLKKSDKRVVQAFLDRSPTRVDSKMLTYDPEWGRLDGNWMGGRGIAWWHGGYDGEEPTADYIRLGPTVGRGVQKYQRMIRRMATNQVVRF